MASAKRLTRLLNLVEVLQSGVPMGSSQLAAHCRVSRRTVFRDLAQLQDAGLPLRYDEERQGYVMPPRTFVRSTELTLDEVLSLLVLCHRLGDQERGIPFAHGARTAAHKLLASLPPHLAESAGELHDYISAHLDARNPLPGAENWYWLIMRAISGRRQLRVRYRSLTPEDGEFSTLLSPYHVLFHRHSWYVIGRSSLHREVRTFNLGRIVAAEIVDSRYTIPRGFRPDRYFGNAWSMIRGRPRCQVMVRFQPLVAHNVAEVQWHKTQRLTWNADGSLDFHVVVDGLTEIRWWILGYGDQAEVLAPPQLREEMLRHATAMAAMYRAGKSTVS